MQNRVKIFLNPVVRNWHYKGRYVYDFHHCYFFTWASCLESVLILSPSLSCVYPEEKQTHFSSGRTGSGHIRAAGPAAKLWWSFVANSAGGSRGDHPVLKKSKKERGRKTKQKQKKHFQFETLILLKKKQTERKKAANSLTLAQDARIITGVGFPSLVAFASHLQEARSSASVLRHQSPFI